MGRVEVTTRIDAPPAEVWAVLEHVERHVDWMREAVAIRFESERTSGVGTRLLCETKVGPLRLNDRMAITDWEPGRTMGVRHEGTVAGTGRFTLRPDGSGTRFSWHEELRFPWWLGGRVAAAVAGRLVLAPIWRRNLEELKRLVEARRRAAAPDLAG